MRRFEYKIIKEEDLLGDVERALSGYGADGWELVSVTIEKGSHGIVSKTRVYFFKRLRQ